MSAELSGRVDTLENQITYLTQDLLQKIDLSTAGYQTTSLDQQLDVFEDNLLTLTSQLRTLQSLYTNLYISSQQRYVEFTGHTGNTGIHV